MDKIGFIGIGNMGYAMLRGATKVMPKDKFLFTDINSEKAGAVEKELGVTYVSDNLSCVKEAKYIIMAVKPQYYQNVIDEIKNEVTKEQIIISLAPNVTISELKDRFEKDIRILRVMPNTPAMVLEGMTAGCYSNHEFLEEEKETLKQFFESFGEFEIVEENLISAVICASGSSPAYVYMFIEALADSAVRYGLPRDKAYKFAAQAVKGSAQMVLETGEHPGKLKDNVCSPAGTTIAAVEELERCGLRNALFQASKACYRKAEKLD
ncbi:MAG: pyrroline-5-carboxylate reductase [Lachnospiraceae bacterium]|nr:pyrroline-5-carboxylate reductase [Lachnospiraceae bacterium]